MEKKYDVFISYSSKDQKVAEGICGYLESHQIRCFVAYRDIPKGKVWAAEIVNGLDKSQMMVVVFSNNFNCSEQVDREIELAAEDKKAILTYRITNDQFQGAKKYYLKNLNWIDAFPNPEASFGALYSDVCKLLGKQQASDCATLISTIERHKVQTETKQEISGTNLKFNVNGVSFEMIKVEGGTFIMGSTSKRVSEANNDKKLVTLSDYYIGKYEVTQELWKAVMRRNPSDFKGAKRPVEQIDLADCERFINKLNALLSSQLGSKRFALPTEAQWEYAARGGKKSKGYVYAGSNNVDDVAWYTINSFNVGPSHPDYGTHVVGTKRPNELGIYDMSGNVFEWCQNFELRGGCWYRHDGYCSVLCNDYINFPRNCHGLRLVLLP